MVTSIYLNPVCNRNWPNKISLDRRKQLEEKITEEERQHLRALIGSLQYASVHTRPDLSSRLSYLQSSINSATVETLIKANQTLHEAKKHHDVTIKIQSIPIPDVRFLAFSDASFASKGNPNSQTGTLIMATHKDIGHNTTCPVGPISWGSKKIQRVVTSTLAAETTSLGTVLDQLSWIVCAGRGCWTPKCHGRIRNKLQRLTWNIHHCNSQSSTTSRKFCGNWLQKPVRSHHQDSHTKLCRVRTQLTARAIKDLIAEECH